MRTINLHMPRFHGRKTAARGAHHHPPLASRLRRVEGVVDYLILAFVVILGAAMAWGLATASGEAPWF